MRKKEETQIHFVGIGGIGMSGIAEVFLNQGYRITGSDQSDSETTKRLALLGAKISTGHRAENVHGAHVVVISSAIRESNPEIQEAKKLRIPVIPRAEMLGELMRGKTGIAVAGSHGKTTTTSMLSTVLTSAGLDPTLVIGGRVDSLGGNAKLGRGKYVVAEADESDGSFLQLPATYGIITNIDNDHLDHYGSLTAVEDAFVQFVGKLPFYGMAAVCAEDPGVRRCLNRLIKPFMTYGFSSDWDLFAENIVFNRLGSQFDVYSNKNGKGKKTFFGTARLSVPGKHNVLNALATIAIGSQLEIPASDILTGLEQFKGVKRRFDIRWMDEISQRAIIDDYGHHPTEIVATLEAARQYWPGRIITVFQPHRYTRTLHCRDGFLSAFRKSDVVLLTDIYSAGEDPIEGINSNTLVEDMRKLSLPQQDILYSGDLSQTLETIKTQFRDGDLVLCLGAGSITRLPDLILSFVKSGA